MSERGHEGAAAARFQEGNPNLSEGNPSRGGRKSKENRKEIQIKPFRFLRRIEPFQRFTPNPKDFLTPMSVS
jgi:hypothetical protein